LPKSNNPFPVSLERKELISFPAFLNHCLERNLVPSSALIIPPSLCFHLRALAANVALFLIAGLEEFLPFYIHSSVTLPPQ
jgi:hypothetical protein